MFIDGLKLLADADLVLDTANPQMALLESMLKISDKVPALRIVLDHLPNFEPTPDERPAYAAALKEFAKRPQIYVKLSAIIRQVDGRVSTDVNSYRDKLDLLVATFGDDRVLFGSDWPNSDGVAPVNQVFKIAKDYFASKPRALAEKYFWRNSVAAYKWVKREAGTAFTLTGLSQRRDAGTQSSVTGRPNSKPRRLRCGLRQPAPSRRPAASQAGAIEAAMTRRNV